MALISAGFVSALSASEGFQIDKMLRPSENQSDVEKYSLTAIKYGSMPELIDQMKAYIDSAEMICHEKNIEIPSILHLARAEYFFNTRDFNNASQEATIAMKLAKNNNEPEVLVRTLNFMGRYSLKTGFFKESLEYFESSSDLAKKKN